MSRLLFSLVGLSVLVLSACGGPAAEGDPAGDGPRVVATTTILGDVVGQVMGETGTLEVLMEPGQDPHGFAASARQAQALREADLVVANGLGLEEALLDAIDAAASDGVEVLRIADELGPRGTGAHAEDDHAEDDHAEDDHAESQHAESEHAESDRAEVGHEHADGDPHVWFDPVLMAEAAEIIASHLAEVGTGMSEEAWAHRGEAVAEDILAAHEEVERILGEVPEECRVLVTNHDNLGYLAERYGFEILGTVIPGTSTQAEPSAGDFAALAELLRETQVPALFAESVQDTRLIGTLAAEVGRDIQVVSLYTDSVGEPGSGAETYTGLLTTNARRIADALGSC